MAGYALWGLWGAWWVPKRSNNINDESNAMAILHPFFQPAGSQPATSWRSCLRQILRHANDECAKENCFSWLPTMSTSYEATRGHGWRLWMWANLRRRSQRTARFPLPPLWRAHAIALRHPRPKHLRFAARLLASYQANSQLASEPGGHEMTPRIHPWHKTQ
jgi:hypothetical protein